LHLGTFLLVEIQVAIFNHRKELVQVTSTARNETISYNAELSLSHGEAIISNV